MSEIFDELEEDIYEDSEDLLEDDCISGAEEGFMQGYNQAGGRDGIQHRKKTRL